MSFSAISPTLSILFFLTISGLSLTAMVLAVQKLWTRQVWFAVSGSLALVLGFPALATAQAADRIIINGSGCQVTEEDAIGIQLQSDLYLRVDYPDTHWRFGLRNLGMKGLNIVDVALQGAQFTSKQYIVKRAGPDRHVCSLRRSQPYLLRHVVRQ